MRGIERIDVLGCPFDAITFEEVAALIEQVISEGSRAQIVPGNVDFVMKARRDPEFKQLLQELDLIVADGVPITWAATLLRTPLRGRVSGTDLVWRCGAVSAKLRIPIALIGAAPGIAQRAADKILEGFPGAELHALPTPLQLTRSQNHALVKEIRSLNARIVLVALGAPRQERWIHENLEATGAAIGIGVGSAFDIISGKFPRAPRWMADNGLEWLHRLAQEPRRLGHRYVLEDSPFAFYLLKEVISRRTQP